MIADPEREAYRGVDVAQFLRPERAYEPVEGRLGDGVDRIEVGDTRFRESIGRSEPDLGLDATQSRRDERNGELIADRVGGVPRDEENRPPTEWPGQVRPVDVAPLHASQGSSSVESSLKASSFKACVSANSWAVSGFWR